MCSGEGTGNGAGDGALHVIFLSRILPLAGRRCRGGWSAGDGRAAGTLVGFSPAGVAFELGRWFSEA